MPHLMWGEDLAVLRAMAYEVPLDASDIASPVAYDGKLSLEPPTPKKRAASRTPFAHRHDGHLGAGASSRLIET